MRLQQVRFAVRSLRRDLLLSSIVVALLGLGLGANAAIFSVADTLLLRPPAGVKNPDQLRRLYVRSPWVSNTEITRPLLNYPQFEAVSAAFGSRAALAAYTSPDSSFLDPARPADLLRVTYATASYFPVLMVTPARGRFFTSDEDVMGNGADVVVLSHGYWQRRFGSDPSIIGKHVDLGRRRPVVIGVASRSFIGPDLAATDMWVPLGTRKAETWDSIPWYRHWNGFPVVKVIGRITGATPDGWFAERGTHVLRVARDGGWQDTASIMATGPIQEMLAPSVKPAPETAITERLLVFALLVLIIACANVANLLLARALQRRRDIAIRTALGMSRKQLVQEMVFECVALSLLAGICALAFATVGAVLLRTLIAPTMQWTTSPVDLRVAAVTMLLALIVGFAAGLPPALHASRSDLGVLLSSGPRAGGSRRNTLRTLMLVGQTGLSLLLLVGAGLFVRSWTNVRAIDLGYDIDQLVMASVEFRNPAGGYIETGGHSEERSAGLFAAAKALHAQRGVVDVALSTSAPMDGFAIGTGLLHIPGRDSVPMLQGQPIALAAVSNSYFTTVGQRIVRGRSFSDDEQRSGHATIINETAARLFWPGENALDKCMIVGLPTDPCRPIIGIAADAHLINVVEAPALRFYLPLDIMRPHVLLARLDLRNSSASPQAITDILRRSIPSADRVVLKPVASLVEPQLHPWRLGASLFSLLGLLALVIASLGVYSVVSYNVNQRTREIGVRVALGAMRSDIVRLVVGAGLRGVLLGVGVGLLAVFALGRTIAPLLYNTTWRDPVVIGAAAVVLVCTTLVASLVPSSRALRVDPAQVMRAE